MARAPAISVATMDEAQQGGQMTPPTGSHLMPLSPVIVRWTDGLLRIAIKLGWTPYSHTNLTA